ncbi:MAG: hypothetical protein M1114_02590 [Candidatus Dependentiae bacterium]|nr:hypothetical protein [Candidatus Dependentiae bacterium]
MNFTKHFLLLLILASRPLCGNEAVTEHFMQECGLKLLKPSDFKEEDQEFFEFSNHVINETVKAYHEQKIDDLYATGIIVLTRLAQELQKLDGEVPHNPKNAHNLVAIANYELECRCYFSDQSGYKKTTRHVNTFSERYTETNMIGFYADIHMSWEGSDTTDLARLHLYHRLMHPYEKEPVKKDSYPFYYSTEKIKTLRHLSSIAVKTLLVTAIMKDAVLYGMPYDIKEAIYQWNNDDRITPNEQIKKFACYLRSMHQKDIDQFMWNLFGNQLIEWSTPQCAGCETCKREQLVMRGRTTPRKLAWLPRWILDRLD